LSTATSRVPIGNLDVDVDPRGRTVWIAAPQYVFELDTQSGPMLETDGATLRRFPFPGSFGEEDEQIEVTADAVWVASLGKLVKIDPHTGATQGPIDVHGRVPVAGFVSSPSGLWVSWEDGELDRLAPDTGAVVSSFQLDESGRLSSGAGGVWLVPTSGEDHATLIDPTGQPIQTIRGASGSVAEAGGSAWTIYNRGAVVAVDLSTGETVASFRIPRAAILAPDGRWLWVFSVPGSMDSALYEPDPRRPARVWLIEAESRSLAGVADVDVSPASMTALGGTAWVTHYDQGVVTWVGAPLRV
jgi:hypothetical protein